jgi:predicted secreted protein
MADLVWSNTSYLMVDANGDMLPLICAKSFRIATTAETIETTSHGSGFWKTFDYQSLSYSISFDGAISLNDVEGNNKFFDMLGSAIGFIPVNYKLVCLDATNNIQKVIKGTVLVSAAELSFAVNEHASFNLELQGSGAYTVSQTLCDAVITGVDWIPGIGTLDSITYTFNISGISSDTTTLQYSLNDAPRQAITYTPGNSTASVNIELDRQMTHTIFFYPRCASTEDGEAFIATVYVPI